MAPDATPLADSPAERPAQPTRAARLAALTGGAVIPSPDGQTSVVFAPSVPSAPTLAREPLEAASATAPALTPSAPAPRSSTPTDLDIDDLYDRLATRLRRELLQDSDRAGHLMRHLP